ncbi:hypothetical protein DPEC_G00111760 [Dallia pectoralis]|uniref:Uncharacterized protein n=1 Tax=Dallia pectoralis TaxID=75939 RepID=A0ACC2GTT7_DALPE|nr:hypothetical protein DPEC_G00111760 [Dallia pectoralis]
MTEVLFLTVMSNKVAVFVTRRQRYRFAALRTVRKAEVKPAPSCHVASRLATRRQALQLSTGKFRNRYGAAVNDRASAGFCFDPSRLRARRLALLESERSKIHLSKTAADGPGRRSLRMRCRGSQRRLRIDTRLCLAHHR